MGDNERLWRKAATLGLGILVSGQIRPVAI